jgi:hypothetical protein
MANKHSLKLFGKTKRVSKDADGKTLQESDRLCLRDDKGKLTPVKSFTRGFANLFREAVQHMVDRDMSAQDAMDELNTVFKALEWAGEGGSTTVDWDTDDE